MTDIDSILPPPAYFEERDALALLVPRAKLLAALADALGTAPAGDTVTIPRVPTPALLRPFIGCPEAELPEAWEAMLLIAAVMARRAAPLAAPGEVVKAIREYLGVHPGITLGGHTLDDMALELARIALGAGAAPAAVAPFGYVNTYTGQFFFDVDSCRKNNEGHWRTVYLQPAAAPALEAPAATAGGAKVLTAEDMEALSLTHGLAGDVEEMAIIVESMVLDRLAAAPCGLCGADEAFTGTCGGGRQNPRALCFEVAAPAAPAVDAESDGWYLQDTRSYVGNDVLWWAKDGNGYTTDVSKAHVFTREKAFSQAAMRGVDRAWPKAYIDGKTRPAVDMQYINHDQALAAQAKEGGDQ